MAQVKAELLALCDAAGKPLVEKRQTMTKRYHATILINPRHGSSWTTREPVTVELLVDPWRDPPELISVSAVPRALPTYTRKR
jgi:hypothetical protein